jgi:CRISPR-associated exonuclease Cas4
MPYIILILLMLGLVLIVLARRGRARAGLPSGEVVYSDTWRRVERPLVSRRLGLTGKPDYLVEEDGEVIPVEVKSGPAPAGGPRDSHIYRMAAYCLLAAEQTGRRPRRGFIRYADRGFSVDFTDDLEQETLALLDDMRAGLEAEDVHRSHDSAARCRGCGYCEVCDEALVTL